jgi:hypothetical protein
MYEPYMKYEPSTMYEVWTMKHMSLVVHWMEHVYYSGYPINSIWVITFLVV